MIDCRKINGAENELYEIMAEIILEVLETAILFYGYLNEKGNDFLVKNGFSREKVTLGIKNITERYGLTDAAELFFPVK